MSTITADLTCPRCGGDIAPVNIGTPWAGTTATTIVVCHPCGQQWALTATLRPLGPPLPKRLRASLTGST